MASTGKQSLLSYKVEGEGEPIVLICGLEGRGSFWQPVADRLIQKFKVITFDHPGVGESPPPEQYSISAIAEAVVELLGHLGISSAHIVGHSTGGLIAQTLALDHAGFVNQLVISGSWARPDRRLVDLLELRRKVRLDSGAEVHRSLSNLFLYPAELYEDLTLPSGKDSKASSIEVSAEVFEARIGMLLEFDRAHQVGQISANTLVVGAVDDQMVPICRSRELADLIPKAEMVELTGGHFFPRTQSEQFSDVVGHHLGRK